jgi:Interleukin-like EMT inducer
VALFYGGFLLGVVALTWPLARHPASLWPAHHDARIFTWGMASIARRLVSEPLALFQGGAFYPNGESLAYTEPLLPPSLLGLPGFLWGDPILTYNLLLLGLWPLNGLAMAWVGHALTGSRAAAWLAGAVFCLSPYFSDYYLEFQMLLAAPLPVALFAWVRWLETGGSRWLAVALSMLTLQGLTTWYYAIILGLGLVILAVAVLCLRWRGWAWRRHLLALAVGGLSVAAVLLPVAGPYLAIHREFGYNRGLTETSHHYADVTSFVEGSRRSRFYRYAPSDHIPETAPFVGFTVLALAAVSLAWLRKRPERPRAAVWLSRLFLGALAGSLGAAACLTSVRMVRLRWGPLRLRLQAATFLDAVVLLAIALLLVEGWLAWRARRDRRLEEGDWVRCLTLLAAVMALLALGPVIHVAGWGAARGPYRALYDVLLPLHVVRVTVRFAVLTIAGLALLAALGLRWLEDCLAARPRLRLVALVLLAVVLGLEYAVTPAAYEAVSLDPRPVDRVLHADPEEVAILELPINEGNSDAQTMIWSLHHGKRLVNGFSGFTPPTLGELSTLFAAVVSPFPTPEAQAALRRIYPLRYLVVQLDNPVLTDEWRAVWRSLRRDPPPSLAFLGTFGSDDLYRVVALPDRGGRIIRLVSYEFLRTHPVLRLDMQPEVPTSHLDRHVDIHLNDRLIQRVPLNERVAVTIRLAPPFFRARPNALTVTHGCRSPDVTSDERFRIGTTAMYAPGDLVVRSSGDPERRVGSVRLNDVELAPGRRGYNLVALDRQGGLIASVVFDTFESDAASRELAAWIGALPHGTIVAGAVHDEGSHRLSGEAVRALRTLGVGGDLRGRFREAHAFVGVKGALPGSAAEKLSAVMAEVEVGTPQQGRGLELMAFALLPSSEQP